MSRAGDYAAIIFHMDEEGRARADLLAGALNLAKIRTKKGEHLGGKRVSEGVKELITSARVVVALLSRDVKVGEGVWHPSQWCQQELGFAEGRERPVVLAVEAGVYAESGILGDLEQIPFSPGRFSDALMTIVNQVQSLMLLDTELSKDPVRPNLDDHAARLIWDARAAIARGQWNQVLEYSAEAVALDASAGQAVLNMGVAYIHKGCLNKAEQLFQKMLQDFAGEEGLLSKVHANLGLIEELRDGGRLRATAMRKQARHLEQSIHLNHRNVASRAALVLCRGALEEQKEASTLLMDSLRYRNFIPALRREIDSKGSVGHDLLRRLEAPWLPPLLFPVWDDCDDGEQY